MKYKLYEIVGEGCVVEKEYLRVGCGVRVLIMLGVEHLASYTDLDLI